MNRKIRFRAWDSRNKKWLPPERVTITGDGEIRFLGSMLSKWEDNHPGLTNEDVAISWFTSLHDKNGKEIWEGDVVEINDGNDTYIQVVKREKGGYTFDIWEDFAPLISDDALTLKVIGNKFEHPDLLTKSK